MLQRKCFTLLLSVLCIQLLSQCYAWAENPHIIASTRSCHYSFFVSTPDEIRNAIHKYNTSPYPQLANSFPIIAGIVPHHFLAKDMILEFYNAVSKQNNSYDTIILLGPDHYLHGMNPISLTNLPWKTAFGMVETYETLVQKLQEVLNIRLDPEAFTGEHSISIHMDLIKYYFPKAKVVPIMIQSGASFNMIEKLSSVIYPCLENNKTLVLLSMDFSHKSTPSDAEKYDSFTHDIIANKNIKFVPQAHIDRKACLAAMLLLMNQFHDIKLEFLDHSNSAIISHKPDLLNVTSYFVILWKK